MLAALLPALLPVVQQVIDRIPDPEAKAKAQAEATASLMSMLASSDAQQIAVNQQEASSPSLFVSGWRPAVGWLCVLGLGVQTVVMPLLGWALTIWAPGAPIPSVDTETLVGLLVPLLGLGAYRTVEKIRKVSR